MNERIILGRWTEEKLTALMHDAAEMQDAGKRIEFISRQFLGTPYREGTLIGDAQTPERFVINLHEVDCFTFLDYVETMRISVSFAEFRENLKKIRYRDGAVSHQARNHFFTDWCEFNQDLVVDVTEQLSPFWVQKAQKVLNRKEDGTAFVKGIAPVTRTLRYIPADTIDSETTGKLKTGDYVGIYTDAPGLDVTHVGIFIRQSDRLYLRHASSAKESRQVIDQDFRNYILTKPGVIVIRPKG